MFDNLLTRLKSKQEIKNKKLSELRPDFLRFQHNFVESLKLFITQAEDEGLEGIEFQKMKELDNGVYEYYFQVGFVNYVLVKNDLIEYLKPKDKEYGSYSFIFFDGDDDDFPFIRISVFNRSNNRKFFSVIWFSSEKEMLISGDQDLNDDSGTEAAKFVISFLTTGDNTLNDHPSRKLYYKESSKRGNMGFDLPL